MTKALQATLFSLLAVMANAQGFTLFELNYTRFGNAEVPNSPLNEETSFQELEASLNIPIRLKNDKLILVNGLRYRLVTPDVDTDIANLNLHFIGYSLQAIKPLNDKLTLIAAIVPALSSDLQDDITNDDFLFTGSAAMRKKVSEQFSYALGIAFTSRFGEPLVLPIVQIKHQKNRFTLNAALPSGVTALWKNKTGNLSYGFSANASGSQYHLSLPNYDVARFTRINLGPSVEYRVKGPLVLMANAGVALRRQFEFIPEAGSNTITLDPDNTGFFNIGLAIKPQPRQ